DRRDRAAGRHPAQERQDGGGRAGLDQRQRPLLVVPGGLEESLRDQALEVLLDGVVGAEAEVPADLLVGRGDTVRLDVLPDELKHDLLPLGEVAGLPCLRARHPRAPAGRWTPAIKMIAVAGVPAWARPPRRRSRTAGPPARDQVRCKSGECQEEDKGP